MGRTVYLPTFPIEINHSWIGKYTSPMDPIGPFFCFLDGTLGRDIFVGAETGGKNSHGLCICDRCFFLVGFAKKAGLALAKQTKKDNDLKLVDMHL